MFTRTATVRMHDTDAAGVIYFTSLLRWAHETFEMFMQESGVDIRRMVERGPYSLPIVRAEAEYRAPLRLGQAVQIQLSLARLGARSFTTAYTFTTGRGRAAGTARLVHACLDVAAGRARALPPKLRRWLQADGQVSRRRRPT